MEKMWRVGGTRGNKTLLYCYLKFRHFLGNIKKAVYTSLNMRKATTTTVTTTKIEKVDWNAMKKKWYRNTRREKMNENSNGTKAKREFAWAIWNTLFKKSWHPRTKRHIRTNKVQTLRVKSMHREGEREREKERETEFGQWSARE